MDNFVNVLKKALRKGRTVVLPSDPEDAAHMLLSVVMQNQFKQLSELLDNNSIIDVNHQMGRSQRTLLHSGASVGALECIDVLLKRGADPNTKDLMGVHALYHAARNGHMKCVKRLLDAGSDMTLCDTNGLTVLHWLACSGRVELLVNFLNHGASPTAPDTQGQTPLHFACQNGHTKAVTLLISKGGDCNISDCHGRTPLYCACRNGQVNCLKILLDYGANCVADKNGVHPLDLCVKDGYNSCTIMILEKYPRLLSRVIGLAFDEKLPEEQVLSALRALSNTLSDTIDATILERLASKVHQTGMELLSNNSDSTALTPKFLRGMRIVCSLYEPAMDINLIKVKQRRRNTSAGERQSSSSAASSPPQTQSRILSNHEEPLSSPSQLVSSVFDVFKPIWDALQSWFDLLNLEISKTDPEHDTTETESGHLRKDTSLTGKASNILEVSENVAAAIVQSVPPVRRKVYLSSLASKKMNRQSLNLERIVHPIDEIKRSMSVESPAELQPSIEAEKDANTQSSVDLMAERLSVVMHAFALCCKAQLKVKNIVLCGSMHPMMARFVTRHETVLKMLLAKNPTLIFAHFHFLLEHHELLPKFMQIIRQQPYEMRSKWFYDNLYVGHPPNPGIGLLNQEPLRIERENLFRSSCSGLQEKPADHFKERLVIQFMGEEGMGTGVLKEWFDTLSSEILNPDYALFIPSTDGATFQPNSLSHINPDHLNYFTFAGKLMGLAVYHKQLLNVYFTRSFYKHILSIPVNYKDVESIDPAYATNLQWLLDHEIDQLSLGITFTVETDAFGQTKESELKPGGSTIAVTDCNKDEYVQLLAELKLTQAIHSQIQSFLSGFHEIIPPSLLSLFDEYELELLMSGLPQIDIEDWQTNTDYQSDYTAAHNTIQWFWEVVGEYDQSTKAKLLQFVTGSSRVPMGGFACLIGASGPTKFTITKVEYTEYILPSASTCFNLLKLPEYPTMEILKDRLEVALKFGGHGFSFT